MKKAKKIIVAILVMTFVVVNAGMYTVNAGITDGEGTSSHTDVVEHIEEATETLTLDLTNGKTATITTRENLEEIGTVTYYASVPVAVVDGEEAPEMVLEETEDISRAIVKTEKKGATEYTVTALQTEGMPVISVQAKWITKKKVDSHTTFTGVTVDGNDAILVGEPDDIAATGIPEGSNVVYNYRQDDYYVVTTYNVLFSVGNGAYSEEEEVINEVNITIIPPVPGEETTTQLYEGETDEYDWSTQTNRPAVVVPEDANYEVDSYDGEGEGEGEGEEGYQYTYWIEGYEDEGGYWVPVLGKFEEGKEYFAEFTINAKPGYRFAEDVKITVNGQELDHLYELSNHSIWGAHPVKCEYKAETADEVQAADENPATGDNVYVYLVMFGVSALVLTSRKVLAK